MQLPCVIIDIIGLIKTFNKQKVKIKKLLITEILKLEAKSRDKNSPKIE